MKEDIIQLADIKLFVNKFYGRVQEDDLIGPIFNERLAGRWPEHLEKMYRFWQTILLEEHTYYGSPFTPHATLPVATPHFDRWRALFHTTIDELFEGPKAEETKWRADRMAEMFDYKISHLQNRIL